MVRALATYLISGCVGRGVRLGSQSSSGGAGGVWKSENLGTWKSRNLEIWGPGHPEIWGLKNQKKKFKIQIRSAQHVGRSGLVGKKSSWPYLGPSEAIFSIGRKKKGQFLLIFLGWPVGPIHPVWALAAIHPRWGNRHQHYKPTRHLHSASYQHGNTS